jgi:hypothetical protein
MLSVLRKLLVAMLSLAAVVVIYTAYNRQWGSNRRDFVDAGHSVDVCDVSAFGSDGSVGKIGDVGVGTTQNARYSDTSSDGSIRRVFGFRELLHQAGSHWRIEKPYMDVFQPGMSFHISADTGQVTVETSDGRPIPKDARLDGNVVIHIVPADTNSFSESFIYLDDIAFISERSHFSTDGPVKFVSQDAQMLGRGLELVYVSALGNIEFLRITHLESIHLKNQVAALFAESRGKNSFDPNHITCPEQTAPAGALKPTNRFYYRCILSTNAVIDTPQQLISARNDIILDNILWSKSSSPEADANLPAAVSAAKAAPPLNMENPVRHTAGPNQAALLPKADAPSPGSNPSGGSNTRPGEIVVTCDNGILLVPMESALSVADFAKSNRPPHVGGAMQSEIPKNRTSLSAQTITCDVQSRNTIVSGPLEVVFYSNDVLRDANAPEHSAAIPITLTAKKEARFLPASNQVIVQGDCRCNMVRADADCQRRYSLASPVLTVDLFRDQASSPNTPPLQLRHLTAAGGDVSLAAVNTKADELLGGVELKCTQFNYDARRQLFTAAGPGVIKVDNSKISEPNQAGKGFSFTRRCWALVRDFDTLKFFTRTNQVELTAFPNRTLDIGYVPVLDTGYGEPIKAAAGVLQLLLHQTPRGQTELSSLHAQNGITYDDADKSFTGGKLSYDSQKAVLNISADQLWPCTFNGVPVDAVEYDLKTGKVNTKIVGPGVLPTGK